MIEMENKTFPVHRMWEAERTVMSRKMKENTIKIVFIRKLSLKDFAPFFAFLCIVLFLTNSHIDSIHKLVTNILKCRRAFI